MLILTKVLLLLLVLGPLLLLVLMLFVVLVLLFSLGAAVVAGVAVDVAGVGGIAGFAGVAVFDAQEVTAEVVTVSCCWLLMLKSRLLMLKSRLRLQKVCTKAGGSKAKISRGGRYSYGPVRTSGWWTGAQHPILRTWKGANKENRALDLLVNELRLQHRGNAIIPFLLLCIHGKLLAR